MQINAMSTMLEWEREVLKNKRTVCLCINTGNDNLNKMFGHNYIKISLYLDD